MPDESQGSPLSGLGAFLAKHGLATLIAVFFLWWVYEDRKTGVAAAAVQMKDLNGQLLHLSGLLSEYHGEAKTSNEETRKSTAELSRILLAQCLNSSENGPERDRCMGWR